MKAILLWLGIILAGSTVVEAQQAHKTKNLIVFLMDGYRWKELFEGADSALLFNSHYNKQDSALVVSTYWAATSAERRERLMPFVWNTIAQKGQLYGNRGLGNYVNVRNGYWFSYPGRNETFTGYADSLVNSNSYPDNPNENILEFINRQPGYTGKVVTFASWDAVARIINRNRNGMLVNIDGEDVKGPHLTPLQEAANLAQHTMPAFFGKGERLDGCTYAMAKAYLQAEHPRVMYVDLGDNDETGHDGRYGAYLDAAHYADAMIGDLWNTIQKDPFYKGQTTFMICPDHGRGYEKKWTSHGVSAPHSNETYLLVMGPDTPPIGEVATPGQLYQDQFAQTMAHLLGFRFVANHPIGEPVGSVMK